MYIAINNYEFLNQQPPRVESSSISPATSGLPVQVFPDALKTDKPVPTTPTTNSKFAPALGRVLDSPQSPSSPIGNGIESNPNKFAPTLGRVLDSPNSPTGNISNKFAPMLGRVLDSPSSPSVPANNTSSVKIGEPTERSSDSPLTYSSSPVPAKKLPVFSSVTAPKSKGSESAYVAPSSVSYSPLGSQYNGISANRFDDISPTFAMENLNLKSNSTAKSSNGGRWTDELRSASPRPITTPEVHNYRSG